MSLQNSDLNRDPVVIVGAKRTPMGKLLGTLSSVSSVELGSVALEGALKDASVSAEKIQEVFMGCVLSAGVGQAPARQAALKAGLPVSTGCTTVNKVCGSGMRTVMFAADSLAAGSAQWIMAGGMESMSQAPYMLPKGRQGYRMGHGTLVDHMIYDGLEDAYRKGTMMAQFAESMAQELNISKEQQDTYAHRSASAAVEAQAKGVFTAEIAPVLVQEKKTTTLVDQDELPPEDKIAKIHTLKGIYGEKGTITAANASSINDGAAALVLTRQSLAHKAGLEVKAIIRGYATHAQEPSTFPTAPVGALRKLGAQVGWPLESVDLFEINEAFALVALATQQALSIPLEKINIYGGACALGHPIGASGTRIIVTLLTAMIRHRKSKGMATACIGGGEATALALELP